jgi:hypothetical protein
MKTKLVLFFFLLSFGQYQLCEGKDFDYTNLEGLKSVNEVIRVEINVAGDEPFNLNETKIKEIITNKLRDAKIQVDHTNKANANLVTSIDGETTGGGGARFIVRLSLFSRVISPFKQESKISAIIWSTEIHDEQVMKYDPEKQQLKKVKGDLNNRVYSVIEEAMHKFKSDLKKSKNYR